MAMVYLKDETLLDAAGVLAIISSCFALLTSLLHLGNQMSYYAPWTRAGEILFLWLVVINVFGFSLGLTGGILTLLRQHFTLTISGMVILLSFQVLSVILLQCKYPQFLPVNLILGTPSIIASTLGLIITIKNREAFSKASTHVNCI